MFFRRGKRFNPFVFITEPYCNYRPYYKEAFETMKCYDIAHLLEEAEKLAILIENDQEDEIDETSEYATYNFSDFTNEFVSLLRSSGIGDKLGEYIKEHKESFIEKDDENEKRISKFVCRKEMIASAARSECNDISPPIINHSKTVILF